MKNHFAAFGLKYNLLAFTLPQNSLFKQRLWFITNSRNRNFAVVSRKIILQLLASNKVCRHPLSRKSGLQSFQTEAAVHRESTKLKFCHDFTKNHFAAFGLKQNLLASTIKKIWPPAFSNEGRTSSVIMNLRIHEIEIMPWFHEKSFCSFWPQNRICLRPLSQRFDLEPF